MKLEYNFKDLIKINPTNPAKDNRPNLRIVKCCGNCRYSWWAHSNERFGFCRLGQLEKPPPNRDTPHRDWAHMHTHTTNKCDSHEFKAKGYWLNRVIQWVGKQFGLNGELIDE